MNEGKCWDSSESWSIKRIVAHLHSKVNNMLVFVFTLLLVIIEKVQILDRMRENSEGNSVHSQGKLWAAPNA